MTASSRTEQDLARIWTAQALGLQADAGRQVAVLTARETSDPIRPESIESRMVEALESPLDFPPFSQTTVPGDRVAIAIAAETPRVAEVSRGIFRALSAAGAEADHVALVTSDAQDAELLEAEFEAERQAGLTVVNHDPTDEPSLCFAGMGRGDREIRINREVFDADVVIPVSGAREATAYGAGAYDGVYPALSDRDSIRRYRKGETDDGGREERAREAGEAGWLIGAPMAVKVAPGPGDCLAAIYAGEAGAVEKKATEEYQAVWTHAPDDRASLVIACISGDEREQTWRNFGRALTAAGRLVAEGGAIVVCSNLKSRIGKSLRRLTVGDEPRAIFRRLRSDAEPDTWPAWVLATALGNGPVYLASQLAAERVEELGVAPVDGPEEVRRLASRHASCIVLDGAQHAVIEADDSALTDEIIDQ